MKKVLGTLGAVALAGAASAQMSGYSVEEVDNTLDGFRTFDLSIDFTGEYSGSQILSVLSTGTFYQDAVGSDSPPNAAFFGTFPDLEFDTFFAQGGSTSGTTVGTLGVGGGGGPVNIDGTLTDLLVDSTTLQAQFNPSGSDFIADRSDFLVARITVSDDANGTFQFLASANDDIPAPNAFGELAIVDGELLPEPATAALLGLGGLAMLRRRSA